MKIVLAGASGMVGGALIPALRSVGHDIVRLVRRRSASAADEVSWDPEIGAIDHDRVEGAEAFINLAGENLGTQRWTASRRESILHSRVNATRTLVSAVARMKRKPAVFLNASAVGYYGDRGDDVLTETTAIGHGFLPEVCLAWETHAEGAARLGVRTAMMRFGIILTRNGGALAKMLPLFRLGVGGRLGSGQQWMSWISLEDVVHAIIHALNDSRCAGPINFVAPEAVTNAEFTTALGRALGRPTIFPVPAWALRTVVGRGMADEALLASTRAAPQRLNETGYPFRHPTIASAFQAVV